MTIGRRHFVRLAAVAAAAAGVNGQDRRATFGTDPFTLGVASGDPSPDGFVLWTRLAPDPLNGGGVDAGDIGVRWEVASDEMFRQVLRSGTGIASAELAHSVHVEVTGLESDRWYWYRFAVGDAVSSAGRARTMPAPESMPERLSLAFASCQHYETGFYTAYEHMAAEHPDLVFHLGDYIYEGAANPRVRAHRGGELTSLEDYRNRYALYRTDPDLQRAHAACPWVVTWDDHEVDNNYANDVSEEEGLPAELFLRRRAAAYQAYYEHMPLRRSSLPNGPDLQLYRAFDWGDLASFHVLDTRQFRTDQPCGDRRGVVCDGIHDPAATLLGETQERWLVDGLDRSTARWNVIPQQIMMARVDFTPGAGESYGLDVWSGYEVARRRLMEFLATRQPANPVVLTGDIHSNWVADLQVDYGGPAAPVVGTEFVGTSISSSGDGADTRDNTAALLGENPWIRFYNGQRGYVRCDLTPERCRADYQVLEYVTRPDSPISTRASFLVEDGRPGAQRL